MKNNANAHITSWRVGKPERLLPDTLVRCTDDGDLLSASTLPGRLSCSVQPTRITSGRFACSVYIKPRRTQTVRTSEEILCSGRPHHLFANH
jgi:hypothetical protein